MASTDRVRVRFGQTDDLTWCMAQDDIGDEDILRHKLERQEVVVAELNGQLVGYLRLEFLWSKVPYIGLIVVAEGHRRRGIGRAMLEFVETHLRARGHKMLLSSSQVNEPEPQAWHRAMGFEECGFIAGINESGIGEVFFRKTWNP